MGQERPAGVYRRRGTCLSRQPLPAGKLTERGPAVRPQQPGAARRLDRRGRGRAPLESAAPAEHPSPRCGRALPARPTGPVRLGPAPSHPRSAQRAPAGARGRRDRRRHGPAPLRPSRWRRRSRSASSCAERALELSWLSSSASAAIAASDSCSRASVISTPALA